MSTRRSSVGVGVVNSDVYAVGGYDGSCRECLSSLVHMFSICWKAKKKIVWNSYLWFSSTTSVERYNPEKNTWSRIADMISRRSGAGVGVLENVLYAVGGHDGPLVRKSCEKYNSETNTWSTIGGEWIFYYFLLQSIPTLRKPQCSSFSALNRRYDIQTP